MSRQSTSIGSTLFEDVNREYHKRREQFQDIDDEFSPIRLVVVKHEAVKLERPSYDEDRVSLNARPEP